jgi:Crp-like helix-turn-helix domain
LAQLINTRRQTVTSALRRFAKHGLIVQSNRCIAVISPVGLQRLFEEQLDDDFNQLAS